MADPTAITRGHIAFGIAGAILGLTLGFVAAHQLYGGRFANLLAGAGHQEPAGGPGMAPASASSAMGGDGSGAAAGGPMAGGAPDMATMEKVKAELTSLKASLAADPKDTAVMTRLGNLYMDAGMFDKAEQYYRDALALIPNDVGVRTDMATCIRNQGRSEEALKEFQASVKIDPQHWRGWFNMGIVYLYDQGAYDKAKEMFAKVIELNPGHFTMDQIEGEIERVRAEKAAGTGSAPS